MTKRKFWVGAFVLGCAAACSADHVGSTSQAALVSTDLVISQLYGGGGNTGATYANDFVELTNIGASSVQLSSYAIQYASATGNFSTNNAFALPSFTLQPGQYFLIELGSGGANGSALPTPDATDTNINMGATAGKLALVLVTDELACDGGACNPSDWVDFIGYGTTANQYEGSGSAPAPSVSTADLRKACTDTGNNANDFTAPAVNPRNSSSTFAACATDASIDAPTDVSLDALLDAPTDAILVLDGGSIDSGNDDGGPLDGGSFDAGSIDSGIVDSGTVDSGTVDSGTVDSGTVDAGTEDASAQDASASDGGIPFDAATPKDASAQDASAKDAATGDEESGDNGGCSCTTAGDASRSGTRGALFFAAFVVIGARRRSRAKKSADLAS